MNGGVGKIAVIVPGNTWMFPYLGIYKTLMDNAGLSYDIICWDREKKTEGTAIIYERPLPLTCNMFDKIRGYAAYAKFVERRIETESYDRIVFLTPLVALFLRGFLRSNYAGRFWLDYRDMSWELLVKGYFQSILKSAGGVSVSSPAYFGLMPCEAVLCHNMDISRLGSVLDGDIVTHKRTEGRIVVSNIGYIRHLKCQKEMVDALADVDGIELRFCGDGSDVQALKDYVSEKRIGNVFFSGRYEKSEEAELFARTDFVNIYLPRNMALMSAMSNRFYSALLSGCDMIVNKESVQARYVEDYGLGLCIGDCRGLADKLFEYRNNGIKDRRMELLAELNEDQERFVRAFLTFAGVGQ